MSTAAKLRFVMLMTVIWASLSTFEMKPYRMDGDRAHTCNPSFPLNAQCRLTAPIVTLELAHNAADFIARIDQQKNGAPYDAERRGDNITLVRINTYLDFLFIVLYVAAFWLMASQVPGRLPKFVIGLITFTGVLDISENILLLNAIKTIDRGSMNFTAPGWESSFKWFFLAASSILLGFAILKSGNSRQRIVGGFMLVSGLSTLLGLLSFALLGVGAFLLFFALLAELILLLPPKSEWLSWFNYLYFIRFSLVLWLIMPLLALLDWNGATTAITLGILSPNTFLQIFYCTFFIVASGWLSLTLARVVCAYGEERFGTRPPTELTVGTTMRWSTFLIAQLPGAALLTRVALNSCTETEANPSTVALAMIIGALTAFIFWVVVAILYYWTYVSTYTNSAPRGTTASAFLIPSSSLLKLDQITALPNPPVVKGVRNTLSKSAEILGPGYLRQGAQEYKLHSGHGIAFFLFLAYFALYIGLMGITSPLPMPFVVEATRALIVIGAVAGTWNYLADRSGSKNSRSTSGVKPWYRLLSRSAIIVLIALAVVVFCQPRAERAFPVIASIFVLITFSTLSFSGLAFWADRFRIPVLTTAVVLLTVMNLQFLRADHQFKAVEVFQAPTPPTPDKILADMEPEGKIRPLIIVTATGGGIHSAMWTSEVLSLLERRFPRSDLAKEQFGFHDSILLASTVSGGSVGMMNFLREYKANPAFDPSNLDDHLIATSACSSLEAVAWGLIYPDLTRLLMPSFFRVFARLEPYDRGYALEQSLYYNSADPACNPSVRSSGLPLGDDPLQLSELHPGRAGYGTEFFPAFTFNTTVTETGDRLLLANYQVEATGGAYCGGAQNGLHSDLLPAETFLETYAEPCPGERPERHLADLRLSTAARLSASFTYVSPAARIQPEFAPNAYHFVDGGYFDNDGTGSVIEFLQAISKAGRFSKTQLQPILQIEIRNGSDVYSDQSPDSYRCQQKNCASSSKPTSWGPWRQLVAPAQAMYLAGHESITRRNRRELCILESDLAPRGPANASSKAPQSGVAIHHVVFSIDDKHAALSWHLTAAQEDFIRSNIPDQTCNGNSCNDRNANTDKGTVRSLEDAVAWFLRMQQNPQSALIDFNDDQTSPVCRVYP